ncbi:thiamine phosphate synthase [Kushneria phosphatilytica]|uniref:thiamine phosphate synthase n=1 Tax=Kushneria phosphatilytica TaxID=657387 RepID=UPI001F0B43D4|nr:thiamine phosphate synthase [Kushneria phosphatilytica]
MNYPQVVIAMMDGDWRRGIYALTDAALLPDDDTLLAAAEGALRGRLALLQYRDKSSDETHRYRQAATLSALCRDFATPLIINDDIALAARLGVGVHLGQQDAAVAEARERLGREAIVGATCHARLDLADQACRAGASYLAFGRFFTSQTKPEAPPAELSLLAEAARFGLPRVAIGGIDGERVAQAVAAGADLLAVVHAVFGAGPAACEHAVHELRRRAGFTI